MNLTRLKRDYETTQFIAKSPKEHDITHNDMHAGILFSRSHRYRPVNIMIGASKSAKSNFPNYQHSLGRHVELALYPIYTEIFFLPCSDNACWFCFLIVIKGFKKSPKFPFNWNKEW